MESSAEREVCVLIKSELVIPILLQEFYRKENMKLRKVADEADDGQLTMKWKMEEAMLRRWTEDHPNYNLMLRKRSRSGRKLHSKPNIWKCSSFKLI